MTAIVTDRFRFTKTKQFFDRLQNGNDLLYLGIGRNKAWADEAVPETPDITPEDELRARQALNSIKKLTDWAYCVPRYTWTSGDTYVEYDDKDPLLSTKKYYVFSSTNFAVYICLKAGSGASTVEPTGTATTVPTAGADGYIWKYLYTITAAQATKFLTSDYIPVFRDSAVAAAAVEGAIHNIKLLTGGAGYTSAPTVAIEGDGSGATATATISGGAVTGITVTNVGSGYTYAKVTLTGGGATTAATARAIMSPRALGREIGNVTIKAAGATYTNGTANGTIIGDGYGATVSVTVSGGVVSSVNVVNAGYNYTVADVTLPVADFGSGDGNADLEVTLSAKKGGFGYDPNIDLNSYYIMVNTTITGAEGNGDFFADNDFRQIVLLKNPLTSNSGGTAFIEGTGKCLPYLGVAALGTWVVGDIIQGSSSNAQAYIVSYDSTNERVYYYQDEATGYKAFTNGETLTATGSGTSSGTISATGASNTPEVDRYTGEMLYLENRVATTRNPSQTEDLKLVIQF